jgi:transcriptional regulator with XRE-family HTH domain
VDGRRIQKAREEAGFTTQRSFAEALGLDQARLSRIESGQRAPDTMLLRQIARAVDVPVDLLLAEAQSEPLALARRGDADAGTMAEMVGWGMRLQENLAFVERETTSAGA